MKKNNPQTLIIKKYENRRLYNTLTSQYINQEQVAQLVREGHDVRVVDAAFPATRGLPATFEWTDECYYTDHINPDIHPLLVTDPARLDDPQKAEYPGDRFGDALPLAWYHNFDGGREFYLALGHNKQDYANPTLVHLIQGGILWTMGRKP